MSINKELLENLLLNKKKEANLKEKEEYQKYLLSVLDEEGISINNEKFLYDGMKFDSYKAFSEYLLKHSNQLEELEKLYKGKKYIENNDVTCRILVALMALMINSGARIDIIASLIKRIPKASRTKDGNRSGNLNNVLKKYFFNLLDVNVQLPVLNEMKLENGFIQDFREMINCFFDEVNKESKLSPNVKINLQKCLVWLEIEKQNSSKSASEEKNQIEIDDKEENKGQAVVLISEKVVENAKSNIIAVEKAENELFKHLQLIVNDELKLVLDDLLKSREVLDQLEHEKIELEKQVEVLMSKINNLEALQQRDKDVIKKQGEKIALQNKFLAEKDGELHILKKEILSNQKDLLVKDAKIVECQKFIKESQEYAKNQENVGMAKLANDLKIEYIDYLEAKDMEMDSNLGENLRDQLCSVFAILENHGIVMK